MARGLLKKKGLPRTQFRPVAEIRAPLAPIVLRGPAAAFARRAPSPAAQLPPAHSAFRIMPHEREPKSQQLT